MPVSSISSRKRVWTGDASDGVEADNTTSAECALVAQPRKHFKHRHTPQPLSPQSKAPLIAPHSPALVPACCPPPAADWPAQPPLAATSAAQSSPQQQHLQPGSAAPVLLPLSSVRTPPFAPTAPACAAETADGGRVANRKRSSASVTTSSQGDGADEDEEWAGSGQRKSKRHNSHSSFSCPPPLSTPLSPSSPNVPVPAPFAYDLSSPRLSNTNVLLRSLHAERVHRKQQQQQPVAEAAQAQQRVAGAVGWSTRPRGAAATEGDYCMLPLYDCSARDDTYSVRGSWASSDSSGTGSSGSTAHWQPDPSSGWSLLGAGVSHSPLASRVVRPASICFSQPAAVSSNMSDDGNGSASLHRTTNNESMNDS